MKSDVIIIGAGPAGLAAAGALKHRGIDALVLEKSPEIAHSWKTHYDRLRLNSVKMLSGLPHMAMPAAYPLYPTRQQVVDYLEAYAKHFGIKPVCNTQVTHLARDQNGWTLQTSQQTYHCTHLIIATSANNIPNYPHIAGLESFPGKTLHSKDYRNATPFTGQRVLVMGSGNSGSEIALDLAEQGAQASLVVRSPIHVTPLNLFGFLPTHITSYLFSFVPLAVADAIAGFTLKLAVGDLSRYGIQRPERGPMRMLEEERRVAMFDTGVVKLIKSGQIKVMPGVEKIAGDTVYFQDGQHARFDSIIFATGFKSGLHDLFDTHAYHEYVGEYGMPRVFGKDAGNQLYFVGFEESRRGMLADMRTHAIKVARHIARQKG